MRIIRRIESHIAMAFVLCMLASSASALAFQVRPQPEDPAELPSAIIQHYVNSGPTPFSFAGRQITFQSDLSHLQLGDGDWVTGFTVSAIDRPSRQVQQFELVHSLEAGIEAWKIHKIEKQKDLQPRKNEALRLLHTPAGSASGNIVLGGSLYPSLGSASTSTWVLFPNQPQAPPSDCECTKENLVRALELAQSDVRDPNASIGWRTSDLTWPAPSSPADNLRAEADKIEKRSKEVQWIRAVLAACNGRLQ